MELFATQTQYGTHTAQSLPIGWRFRETPGHGFLHPSQEANKRVPASWRHSSYEEDCAYVIPIYFNPQLFTEETWLYAEETLKSWFPKKFEKLTGTILQRGESTLKDQYYWPRVDKIGFYQSEGGYGDWCFDVPKGYVYRECREITKADLNYEIGSPTGQKKSFLFHKDDDPGNEPFDPTKFQQYTRNEEYYTWEEYTSKTGKQRFK